MGYEVITESSTEEDCQKLHMLLAEAGFPDATVVLRPEADTGFLTPQVDQTAYRGNTDFYKAVWKAFRIHRSEWTPDCFECWSQAYWISGKECDH